MRQPPGIFPGRPAIGAALAALTALAASIPLELHREAAYFVLGAAFCAIGLALARRMTQSGAARLPGYDAHALRLLDSVAGELKKAVDTIAGFSAMIAEWSAREGTEWRDSCDHLVDATRQLTLFTAQLHDYARYERGALHLLEQQVDAAELVAAALGGCEDKAEQADTFIEADLSGSAEIRCDAGRIRQAIASLVQWVVEASPPGSVIGVSLGHSAGGGIDVRIVNPAALTPMGDGADMFEPPLPLKGLDSLALPIARRVALLHCGDLRVDAAHGAGASATLSLPAHRVDWPDKADTVPPRAA